MGTREFVSRFRALFDRRRGDVRLSDEIHAHLDLLTEEHIRRGLPRNDARAAARREFGGVEQMKERYRDQRGLPAIESWWRDARFGLRTLRRNPGFATVAVLTLALGIGANTAIFSVVDGVMLRPLAYDHAARLVAVHELVRRIPIAPALPVNAMHFRAWRETAGSFDQLALIGTINLNLTGSGDAERLSVARSSWNLFSMLGVQAQLGRTFVEAEDQVGRDHVVVLSDSLWRRRFGGDPRIVGRRVTLDDQPFEVVGVLPQTFWFPTLNHLLVLPVAAAEPQLWKPFGLRDSEHTLSGDYNYACVGRLRPGVSVDHATAELNATQADLDRQLPERPGLAAMVVPLRDQVASRAGSGLWMLLAAAGVVLLIACVNVTNLLIGQAAARQRELSIRLALGATPGRLARQLLAESGVLVMAAAGLGVVIAYVAVAVLTAHAPIDLPRVADIHLDGRVLAFMLAVSIVTTIGVGLIPAWGSGGRQLGHTTHRITPGRATLTLRAFLVVAEIGLCVICLMAAGLLLHSFVRLTGVERGFESRRVLATDLSLSPVRYSDLRSASAFVRALVERVSSLPGVESVGVVGQLPLAGAGGNNQLILDNAPENRPIVDMRPVNHEYFKTLGVSLRSGRIFDDRDSTRLVAVVSASTAARAWPGQSAVGKRFRLGTADRPQMEVIGTVNDVLGVSLSSPPSPTVYFPYWQRSFNRNRFSLAVKTAVEPAGVAPSIRSAIRELDRDQSVSPFRTMDDVVDDSLASRRFQTGLVVLFGICALLLAMLGTYGVISYSVYRRTNEIGIRLALGAARGHVVREVLTEAFGLLGLGLATGLPLAIAVGYGLRSVLYGVGPHDGIVVMGTCGALSAAAALAALVPAWRASRVDPLVALKRD